MKIFVTKDEVEATIATIRNHKRGTHQLAPIAPQDAVVDLLVRGGNAVRFVSYTKADGVYRPAGWVHGLRGLDLLRSGFGSGRLRSLEVDITTGTTAALKVMVEAALKATNHRRIDGKSIPATGIHAKNRSVGMEA